MPGRRCPHVVAKFESHAKSWAEPPVDSASPIPQKICAAADGYYGDARGSERVHRRIRKRKMIAPVTGKESEVWCSGSAPGDSPDLSGCSESPADHPIAAYPSMEIIGVAGFVTETRKGIAA